MADKRGFVRRNRGLFNNIKGPSDTNNKYILKHPDTEELNRRCGKESETVQHITAACEQLAATEYVKRHDGLAKIIHQKLAEAAELIDDKSPHYKSDVWLAVHRSSMWDKKPTRCHLVLYFFLLISCLTCFGPPCAHLQELTT